LTVPGYLFLTIPAAIDGDCDVSSGKKKQGRSNSGMSTSGRWGSIPFLIIVPLTLIGGAAAVYFDNKGVRDSGAAFDRLQAEVEVANSQGVNGKLNPPVTKARVRQVCGREPIESSVHKNRVYETYRWNGPFRANELHAAYAIREGEPEALELVNLNAPIAK
jgi:hypothetical protein